MAEYRPYRVMDGRAQTQLLEIKVVGVTMFMGITLILNWMVTQQVAGMFGYARGLGVPLIGGLYAPWEWMVWWARWHAAARLAPVWAQCTHELGWPVATLAALLVATIGGARYQLRGTASDLYGSARWATLRDVRAAGFIRADPLRAVAGAAVGRAGGVAAGAAGAGGHLSRRLADVGADFLSARLRAGACAGVRADAQRQGRGGGRADLAAVAALDAGA